MNRLIVLSSAMVLGLDAVGAQAAEDHTMHQQHQHAVPPEDHSQHQSEVDEGAAPTDDPHAQHAPAMGDQPTESEGQHVPPDPP